MRLFLSLLLGSLWQSGPLAAKERTPVFRGAVELVSAAQFQRLYHRDPVTIERVECRGHEVHVHIRYPGGQRPHEFRLLSRQPTWWHQKFPPNSRRPYPVYRPALYLSHNANAERGREPIRARLIFDLRPLRRWPGPIPMKLNIPQTRKSAPAIELLFK